MAGAVLRLVIKEFEGFSWTNCFSVPTVFVVSKEHDGHCICLKVFVWFQPEQQINDEQLAYFSIQDRSFLSIQGGFKFWESRRFHVDVIGSSKVF